MPAVSFCGWGSDGAGRGTGECCVDLGHGEQLGAVPQVIIALAGARLGEDPIGLLVMLWICPLASSAPCLQVRCPGFSTGEQRPIRGRLIRAWGPPGLHRIIRNPPYLLTMRYSTGPL